MRYPRYVILRDPCGEYVTENILGEIQSLPDDKWEAIPWTKPPHELTKSIHDSEDDASNAVWEFAIRIGTATTSDVEALNAFIILAKKLNTFFEDVLNTSTNAIHYPSSLIDKVEKERILTSKRKEIIDDILSIKPRGLIFISSDDVDLTSYVTDIVITNRGYQEITEQRASLFLGEGRDKTREIGTEIDKRLGFDGMVAVHTIMEALLGSVAARELEFAWNDIGQWKG